MLLSFNKRHRRRNIVTCRTVLVRMVPTCELSVRYLYFSLCGSKRQIHNSQRIFSGVSHSIDVIISRIIISWILLRRYFTSRVRWWCQRRTTILTRRRGIRRGTISRRGTRGGSSSFRREDRGGGVERGFGSAPDHSPGLLPSVEIRNFQYTASRAK